MLALTLGACAGPASLPDLVSSEETGKQSVCPSLHPRGDWQYVHSIAFTTGQGTGSTLIGVTTLTRGAIDCTLMTLEGLVLFEGRHRDGKAIEVLRALPPFDGASFARAMMEDVRFLFLPPGDVPPVHGLDGEREVCRYSGRLGRVSDVYSDGAGCWSVRRYDKQRLERELQGAACTSLGDGSVPARMELLVLRPASYTLKMTLISAEPFARKKSNSSSPNQSTSP